MRFARVSHAGLTYFARLEDEETARLWTGAPFAGGVETDRLVPLRRATLLPPVHPTKIVCVGRNYGAHARELGNEVPKEPLLFLKPPSALLAHGGAIELPRESERVEHEGELAVVVGARLRHADESAARAAIFGLTCANDITARDLQRADVQFTRAKGFDTFAPCGPFIVTDVAPDDLSIRVTVDGTVRQDGRTRDMIVGVPKLLAFISRVMTLEPGDLVLTGTPEGVGPLAAGQRVTVEIEGVGRLENTVQRSGSA